MKKSSFPFEPWSVSETEYNSSEIDKNASLFFLGNGYLGFRGGFEEDFSPEGISEKGTFINGFYESAPQSYGESAYGFPDKKQAMLNLPDPTGIRIRLDDENYSLSTGKLIDYNRRLSLKDGLLHRKIRWESPGGRRMSLEITRCLSMVRTHLAVISLKISELEGVETLRLSSICNTTVSGTDGSKFDPRTAAGFEHKPLECIEKRVELDRAILLQRTTNSRLVFSEVVSNSHCPELRAVETVNTKESIEFIYEADAAQNKNQIFTLDKYISFYTTIEENEDELIASAVAEVDKAEQSGIRIILDEHIEKIVSFWKAADIEIDNDELQQGIRFNLFSLYQSAGTDGRRNIAAKGLSGEGYEGHYFWDTEIYVIPFFSYTFPADAAKLLEYRYSILDKARARAEIMSEKGALFPWRTINGEEASAFFPAGTAQYHINADIAYGINKYGLVSGDDEFLKKYGLEILIETARFWMSLGFFDQSTGSFRINTVTGPDEYTAIVNNNYFTNIMAKNNLIYAAEAVAKIKAEAPADFNRTARAVLLRDEERSEWLAAADAMFLPYNEELCVHAQDDSFLQKEKWDFSNPVLNKHPLLLNLHPLVIYRYQILKQPDLVLANFLQGDSFTRIQKMRDYEYYNPLTTGDSSLSPCIQSIMAAELGRVEEAYDYFMKTARMDLDDRNSNVCDGIHIAAMGGTWLSLIYGFAGLREGASGLEFYPRLPAAWNSLNFKLRYRGCVLVIRLDHDKAVYGLEDDGDCCMDGNSLRITHMGKDYTIRGGAGIKVSMKPELRAVIFDLDGVITDTSEYHYLAWKQLADEKGYKFSRAINERLRGIGRLESLDIILEESGVTLNPEDRYQQGEDKNEYYKALLHSISPENILPGVRSFISELREHGIKTALASASRNAPFVIKKLGISSDFDIIMDAAAIERGKPDPEIFVTAAERLKVFPEQAVGVEDAAAGIESIRAAGMYSVGVGDAASEADWSIDSTEKLSLTELLKRFGD